MNTERLLLWIKVHSTHNLTGGLAFHTNLCEVPHEFRQRTERIVISLCGAAGDVNRLHLWKEEDYGESSSI